MGILEDAKAIQYNYINDIYVLPTFIKSLGNVYSSENNLRKSTILGFRMYALNISDLIPNINVWLSEENGFQDFLKLFQVPEGTIIKPKTVPSDYYPINTNRTGNARIFSAYADFTNINELTNELMISTPISTTNLFDHVNLMLFTYELYDNKPLLVTERGIEFTSGTDNQLATAKLEISDTDIEYVEEGSSEVKVEKRTPNVAFALQMYSRTTEGTKNPTFSNIGNDDLFRVYLDLHKYIIASNLVSVTNKYTGRNDYNIDLGHSHGLYSLRQSELYLNNSFSNQNIKDDSGKLINISNLGLSTLTSFTEKTNYNNVIVTHSNLDVFEDYDRPDDLGLTDIII